MPAYFPKIHPDELLASAIARYHVHTRGVSHRETHLELYASPHSRTSVNFPRNLRKLHRAIALFTGLTLRELVKQTTLFPYYFAFAKEEVAEEIYDKMVSPRAKSHSIVLGWSPVFDKVKVCLSCIKSDEAEYGEAYWHRSHQLHAAHLCSIHATPLVLAKTRYFNDYSTPLEPLTEAMETESYLPSLSEKTRQRLMEIAQVGEAYLAGLSPTKGIQPFENSTRAVLRAVYPCGRTGLDMTRIEQDVVSYFGEQCLELLQLGITPGVKSGWIRNQFRRAPSPMPTKHIIFKLFMEHSVMPKLKCIQFDAYDRLPKEPWACQNPAAEHLGEKVVETVYKVAGFQRTGVLGFKCTCGYTFLAKTRGWNFRSQPKKFKVQEFGQIFISKARELRTAGHTISEIARRLDVRRNVIYSILDETYGTTVRPTPTKALEGRKKKVAAIAGTVPPVSRTKVASTHRVDYPARDNEYVELFTQAAAKIRLTSPPVRASVNHILEVAGIGYSQLVRHQFFPLSLAKLKELGETTDSIRTRRKAFRGRKLDEHL